jgi:thioredoxin-related protein
MITKNRIEILFLVILEVLNVMAPFTLSSQSQDKEIIVHLLRAYDSKISLLYLSGINNPKFINDRNDVKQGASITFVVPKGYLPGEFVLRFDYRKGKESSQVSSEKNIFLSNQDLELWVNPSYCKNSDSTLFQPGERENSAFVCFMKENNRKKEKLGVLQKFLVNYDDTATLFYRTGTEEYERKRASFNEWIDSCLNRDRALFVSCTYRFQYLPIGIWHNTPKEKLFSIIYHYFDGIDFNDSNIIKTLEFNDWMNHYVNLSIKLAATPELMDSTLSFSARNAIEKARYGRPQVYGGMVDYFYRGFEMNNIPQGMKVLEPYLNDPECLTSKRMEIKRRLKGMETMAIGSKAPEIILNDADSILFELSKFEPSSKYILLLFWSAECSHCTETINVLYPWIMQPGIHEKISVVAISLDETGTEVKAWNEKMKSLIGWKHIRAADGIKSKVANDYYVLATPVMFMLAAKTKEIISLPVSVDQLKSSLLKGS